MTSHINTVDGVTVVVHNRPFHIAVTDKHYHEILGALDRGAHEEELYDILTAVRRSVEQAVKLTPSMEYSGGVVTHCGRPLHGYAVEKLVELINLGKDATPLAMFLDKLQHNPSSQTIDELYLFLEHGRIPITKNGNFLVYKAIRADWKDIHSGRFDNSIGATPKMPRSAVDDRREHTCSRGLHVCGFEYLPHFAHTNGHVVVCEVNPADVVSIPNDYNNTKMRVCEYRVVGEVEGYYKEHRDILGEQAVWEPSYVVFARETDTDEWTEVYETEDRDEAIAEARDELMFGGDNNEEWTEVKVVDSEDVTVFREHN